MDRFVLHVLTLLRLIWVLCLHVGRDIVGRGGRRTREMPKINSLIIIKPPMCRMSYRIKGRLVIVTVDYSIVEPFSN